MQWPEQPWHFERGAQFTIIMMHRNMQQHMRSIEPKPGSGGEAAHSAPKYRYMQQHLGMHGYYVPAHGEPAEYHYLVTTTTDPARWQWIDRPNLFLLFTHFGGPPTSVWSPFAVFIFVVLCAKP